MRGPLWLVCVLGALAGCDSTTTTERDFDSASAATAAPTVSVTAPPSTTAAAAPSPASTFAPAPSDREWAGATRAALDGEQFFGCTAHLLRGWARIACRGSKILGRAESVTIEKSHSAQEVSARVTDGLAVVVTPFVEGSMLRARVEFAQFRHGSHTLTLQWKKRTPRPRTIGRIELEAAEFGLR